MLSRKPVPDYDEIITHLNSAIDEVKQMTRQTEFEWIKTPPPSTVSKQFGK